MSRVGGPRIAAAVVVLAAVGVLLGYLAGLSSHDEPRENDKAATPLVAASPSAPIDAPVTVKPDNDYPALGVDLEYVDTTLGAGSFELTLPVPAGWFGSEPAPGEMRWTPEEGGPDNTYQLRVEQVSDEHQSMDSVVDQRAHTLDTAAALSDVEVLSKTSDTLTVTYVDGNGYRRIQILRWIQPRNSGEAEVEIAVAGRMVDRNGLDRLIDYVSDRIVPAA